MEHLLKKISKRGPLSSFDASIDAFVSKRRNFLARHFRKSPCEVYVTGSYARGTATPFSDLDLIFLVKNQDDIQTLAKWVEGIVYPLYKVFPTVEHSFRTVDELSKVIQSDFRVYFSLKEAVHVHSGKKFPLPAKLKPNRDDLLIHVRRRWDRYSYSPCLVEMNVKDSPGGLVDYENFRRLGGTLTTVDLRRYRFLVRFRWYLHALHGKRRETGSFAILRGLSNEVVAELYDATIGMYRHMNQYFEGKRRRLKISNLRDWFDLAAQSKRKFNAAFLSDDFKRLFPPMSKLLRQCSGSGIHRFTVGWHSSECLKVLKDLLAGMVEPAPLGLEEALSDIKSVETLYLAVFLHDMGKAMEGDHAQMGAKWVRSWKALQKSVEQRDLVAWLIEFHLDFHHRSMKKDILSQEFLDESLEWIPSRKHLSYLYLLTIIDLIGTNRSLWTVWRAQLLGKAFLRIYRAFEGQSLATPLEIPRGDSSFLSMMPAEYRLTRSPSHAAQDRLMLIEFESSQANQVDISWDDAVGFSVLAVAASPEVTSVFRTVLQCLFDQGVGVWRSRTYHLPNGSLSLFWVYPYGSVSLKLSSRKIVQLKSHVKDSLLKPAMTGSSNHASPELLRKQLENHFGNDCVIQVHAPPEPWDLHLNAPDREGLLKDLVRIIDESGFAIVSANIGTTGDRALDHFKIQGGS